MKCVLLVLVGASLVASVVGAGEQLIRRQFVEYFGQAALAEPALEEYLASIGEMGTWPDIDYASQRRGEWPTRTHLDRLKDMAAAFSDRESPWFGDEAMKRAVLSGLDHWIRNDYQNPNWYNGRIGVPYRLGSALLLMGDAVPQEMLEAARRILYRSELGLTGQNKVWCAGIGIMKGVLYGDRELLDRAVAEVWSELRVSTGEGIQPDWSFHQHGPQQQFGNYGDSFGVDMVQWASVLRGTEFALAGESLEVLRNYLLEGPSWILWKGRMDLSGCGRHLDEGSQLAKARSIRRQLERMKAIDPDFRDGYQLRIDSMERRGSGFVGFNPFWRSEMAVQRRPDWYASVKLSSTRVIGSESCNEENMLGLHLGDGVLLTYVDGDEYEDLVPLWDWRRLPGTSCDQGLVDLTPATLDGFGGSDFSGVLGAGETGMAAMVYKRGGLEARKAWFFLGDRIFCLGAGIRGETIGPVFTSVEQSRRSGAVKQEGRWVWHNGIGYEFLDGEPEVLSERVQGNWKESFPTRGDRPESGDVFSIWIDHGKSPHGGSYAYRVYPELSLESAQALGAAGTSRVLANSPEVQAVEHEGSLYAVFYEAGGIETRSWGEVAADGPCLLVFEGGRLLVSDPTHSLQALTVQVEGKAYRANLPPGAERGRQVEAR
ncbi:polysaccharide lyase family 8 super-sandwich domain-containing protein [Pelagicoccus sp. SDUM812005]|uniref:polysaccharide lyase family 8 super-sandwich domain-containing protein n=1 Tax=Pelagicoccus sp. SDUM812005 TaxID=3041257 RepID=UPI00280E07D3|nr:polysaccharide lyase family 8 super-sandwich domain-containing protein [Pelagicoccus sp. SDUM812005]MDQ8183310.1 polysaccharide lyase family 8 super-sandwich domain-containing protein [Pelagicoccus sp. SDUM812005]